MADIASECPADFIGIRTPTPTAASSLERPAAISAQNWH